MGDKNSLNGKTIQVPVTPEENLLVRQLISRYQHAVTSHNRETGHFENANVYDCEIMRAGLVLLAPLQDEELRSLVNQIDRKRKGPKRKKQPASVSTTSPDADQLSEKETADHPAPKLASDAVS